MELIAIKTRRLEPPKDDLFEALDKASLVLCENDVLVIASKVVAIHEGRCVKVSGEEEKKKLIEIESDFIIPTPTPGGWDLTIKNNMVSFAGGVDESNAGGYLVLLPEHPNESAKAIREHLCAKYSLTNLGVIITDSSGIPFRQGVMALSIGHAGFKPINNRVGPPDLYGWKFKDTYINVVDALAVAAGFVMGETNESTPACIVRDTPFIVFTDEDRTKDLLMRPEDDVFYPLFKETYYRK